MPKTTIDFSNIKVLEQGLSAENDSFGELLELSDKQISKIKRRLKQELESWESDSSELHDKLQHWYDLSEGVVEEIDEPFPGAFQTHVDLIGIYLKVYASVEKRSILGPENLWYTESEPGFDQLESEIPKIDEMMNYKARAEWNIKEKIGEAIPCANRDSLAALKIIPVDEREEIEDKVILTGMADFLEEFPNPKDSDLSAKEWKTLSDLVQQKATPDTPIEVPVSYERVIYSGPKAFLVERINLVILPSTAQSLDREYCRGHGDRFYIRREEVRRHMQDEEWFKDSCQSFLKKTLKRGSGEVSPYRRNTESIVGIGRSQESDDHEFFYLVYRMRLDSNGSEKKYIFVYNKEHNELMGAWNYSYRLPTIYALFRSDRRPNQLDGRSIVGQLEFVNQEIDQLHNQRFQSWQITNIPSFKAQANIKMEYEEVMGDQTWGPGMVLWLENPEKFQQFDIHPTDQGQTMQEEQNLMRLAALIMGIDAFLAAGRPSPDNPDAPGNKTEMLINQGNMRMEDPIVELRYGVEDAGNICLSHVYQFSPPQIEYKSVDQNSQQSTTQYLSKRILRKGVKMRMSGMNVILNPDAEFQKWTNYAMILEKMEPLIASNPLYRTELVRTALRAGKFPNAEKILPPLDEIKKQMVETQMQAIQQMQAQQMAQKMAAAQQQMKAQEDQKRKMIGALRDHSTVQKLMQQLTESQINGGSPNGSQ